MQNEKTSKTPQPTQLELDKQFTELSQAFQAKITAKIKTNLNARYYPKNYEVNTLPSKAIPDQSMPLKTILERYARGLPLNANTQIPVSGITAKYGIDLRKLDLAEREELLTEVKQTITDATRPPVSSESVPVAATGAGAIPLTS